MISKRNVILLAILLLFLGIIYAPPKTFSVENYAGTLSPKNTDALGTSNYIELLKRMGYKVELGGPDRLDKYGAGDIYILLGPDKELSENEILEIRNFLERGGSILVADELGTVNNLINELFGANINSKYVELYYNKYAKELNPLSVKEIIIKSSKKIYPYYIVFSQVVIVPMGEKALHLEPIGNNTPAETKETFLSLFIKQRIGPDIADMYRLYPSLSSYIGELGKLEPRGYILTIDHLFLDQYIETDSEALLTLSNINHSSIYIYSAQYINEKYRAYVIADTSIFTNQYVELRFEDSIYIKFHKEILNWLSNGFRKTVIFDDTHIIPSIVKQPIPHLGKMILDILVNTSSTIMDHYNNFLSSFSTLGLVLLLILWIPSTYIYLKRRIKVMEVKEIEPEEIVEKLLVYKSEAMTEIGEGGIIKHRYKELINGLYDLLNYILMDKLSTTVSEIAVNKLVPADKLSKFEIKGEELIKLCVRLDRLKRKITEGSFLPIIISWNREIKRIMKNTDDILVKLGYGFISSDMERGIEDVYK